MATLLPLCAPSRSARHPAIREMLRRRLKTVADTDQTNSDGSGSIADRQFRRAAGTASVPDDLGGS